MKDLNKANRKEYKSLACDRTQEEKGREPQSEEKKTDKKTDGDNRSFR